MALKLVSFSKLKTKITASTQDVNCKKEKKTINKIGVNYCFWVVPKFSESAASVRSKILQVLKAEAASSLRLTSSFPFGVRVVDSPPP